MGVSAVQQVINRTYRHCMLGVWLDELNPSEVNVGLMLDTGADIHMPSRVSMRNFIAVMIAVAEASSVQPAP